MKEDTQIIELYNYNITFMPDFAGFLYVTADEFTILKTDNTKLFVKKQLNKLYIEKNEITIIHNPKNLKKIWFEKFLYKKD